MSDIIERLRAAVPTYEGTPIAWPCEVRSELLLEAAAEVERLRGDARAITAIAHTGGTYGLSEREALVEIRRRTLKAWDRKASRARMRDSAFVPLAEVEKLTRERDEARSKETDYREGLQEGWDAAHEGTAAVVKKLREALKEWDALIVHQFHGSRDAMSDMQRAALNTKRILDELDAREALEAKQ
jgi:hypothetical protein